ncbi:MAG: tripartite tricarboxylate transporter substrate binding protein [Burkholderiaceae bacterium]|jgi:tripartite-type tricarboxylate transporter receptor subunit TctC|nr:tripartite tricarboxylate transporter substrate binding protein [Burkholderiaceae bacterium]
MTRHPPRTGVAGPRRALVVAGAAAGALVPLRFARAQAFPNKPIKLVVPFPAGSATDTIARVIGASVSSAIGQPVLVENKAGADGAIAGAEVVRAAPDGYTLLMATNSPMAAAPAMKKNPPYDPITDFTPISDIGRYTFFIVVHPSVPAKTVAELVAFAKAKPGELNYATGNTTGIVSMALFNALGGVKMTHVPYKGEPQALTDLVSGRVQVMVVSSGTSLPHIREGRLRALATTLDKRSPALPDVPTIAEAGMPQFRLTSWAAVFGPAKMPRDVVERLNREFVAAIGRPDVQQAMEKQAFMLQGSTPEQLGALVKEQFESYKSTMKIAGIEPE